MSNIIINGINVRFSYVNNISQKTVYNLRLNEDKSALIAVGADLEAKGKLSGWQSFVLTVKSLFCGCFGWAEDYLADCGRDWFKEIAANDILGEISKIENGTFIYTVAKKVENVAKKPTLQGTIVNNTGAGKTEPVIGQTNKVTSDSIKRPSQTGQAIKETPKNSNLSMSSGPVPQPVQTPLQEQGGLFSQLHSRQMATQASSNPTAMRPGDALHLATQSRSKQPSRIELKPKQEVMTRLGKNLDPKDKIIDFTVKHIIDGSNFQVDLNYIRGSGSMTGGTTKKTFLVPVSEFLVKGSESTQMSVEIGALLTQKLNEMGLKQA